MRQRSTCQACGNLIEQDPDGKWVDPNCPLDAAPDLCLLNEPEGDRFGPHDPAVPQPTEATKPNLWVQEQARNASDGYYMGDSGVYESFATERGELFRSYQAEYGRCTGRVYVETAEGTRDVGWVFEARVKYEDSDDTYLREVWITVHSAPPTRTTTYHYDEKADRNAVRPYAARKEGD